MKSITAGVVLSLLLGSTPFLAHAVPGDFDDDGVGNTIDPDIDGDGIPNRVEQRIGFDQRDPADGALDADSDTWTNADEYRFLTDMQDPNSNPDLSEPLIEKVFAFDGTQFDDYGSTVDIEGGWAVVGAPDGTTTEDSSGNRITPIVTGAVYVYRLNGGEWSLFEKLTPYTSDTDEPIPAGSDFGASVSLSVEPGTTFPYVAVGAPGYGSAYLFTPTDTPSAPFTQHHFSADPVDDGADTYGRAVAIDNLSLAIGCPSCENEAGLIELYDIIDGDVVVAADSFSGCVGISSCQLGNIIELEDNTMITVASALRAGNSSVHFFRRASGDWRYGAELVSTLASNELGHNIALSGDRLLISDFAFSAGGLSGNVYEFNRSGGVWSETGAIFAADLGATAIAHGMALDGSIALLSDQIGNVYGLARDAVGWSLLSQDKPGALNQGVKQFLGVDSTNGFVLIGVPDHDDAGADAGIVYFVDLTTLP